MRKRIEQLCVEIPKVPLIAATLALVVALALNIESLGL